MSQEDMQELKSLRSTRDTHANAGVLLAAATVMLLIGTVDASKERGEIRNRIEKEESSKLDNN